MPEQPFAAAAWVMQPRMQGETLAGRDVTGSSAEAEALWARAHEARMARTKALENMTGRKVGQSYIVRLSFICCD